MYNFSAWVQNTDPRFFQEDIKKLLLESGFWICDFSEKFFEPFWYTCIFTLSESHLAVHTFPEESASYIELSSCVSLPFSRFCENFSKVAVLDENWIIDK